MSEENIQNQRSITIKKKMTIQQVKDTYGNVDIKVAPGVFQSLEDYEANMKFDEARDNELSDK